MPIVPPNARNKQKAQFDQVNILPHDYFSKTFKATKAEVQSIIDQTSSQYLLNEEQDGAFRLIANHASSPQAEPLCMYIAGMGGSGKSRILEAVIDFFAQRHEEYSYIIVAPTGSTAALLKGSTYHSVFSIPRDVKSKNGEDVSGFRSEESMVAAINERIQGVEYIFLDEVSMVSCTDLQVLACQAAKARNIHDVPFGGLSAIFAGDFAQLPPTTGASLYSGKISLDSAEAIIDQRAQNSVLGRIIWHQVLTVVVLRKNIRQLQQTQADVQLHTALTNMQYGACTPADNSFLDSRVVGTHPDSPKLNSSVFCNVSVITAWNSQKDVYNSMGAERFATDTKQTLTHFYSIDSLSSRPANTHRWAKSVESTARVITDKLRDALWSASPTTSDHIPGKLSLCIGIPVMLRANDATELCITKGQEGVVVGWDSSIAEGGEAVLDTLFVKLIKPPKNIRIPDLPLNVVPLPRVEDICSEHINCGKGRIMRCLGYILPFTGIQKWVLGFLFHLNMANGCLLQLSIRQKNEGMEQNHLEKSLLYPAGKGAT